MYSSANDQNSISQNDTNNSTNMFMAFSRKSLSYFRSLDRINISFQSPLLCRYLWRMALPTSGQSSCRCMVLLAWNVHHDSGGPSIPPGDAKNAPTAIIRTKDSISRKAPSTWWGVDSSLNYLPVRSYTRGLVNSTPRLLCPARN
jgi:hypothetical protein